MKRSSTPLVIAAAAAAAKSHQSCPTLCDTIDGSHQVPPSLGFSRQEHWSGFPFPSPMHESEKWKWSRVQLLATPWTVTYQAPPSMGFSRQEYWSGVPLPSPPGPLIKKSVDWLHCDQEKYTYTQHNKKIYEKVYKQILYNLHARHNQQTIYTHLIMASFFQSFLIQCPPS